MMIGSTSNVLRQRARLMILAAAATAALLSTGPAIAQEDLPPRILLGAQAAGTLQNALATAFAKVVSDNAPTTMVLQPYSGTTTFFPLLNNNELDFGFAPSVDYAMSYLGPERIKVDGQNPYPEAENMRLVMGGPPLIASLIVRDDSDIRSANDLKGRTIAGGFPAQLGARVNMYAHLASAGLTWDDTEAVPFSAINDSMDALVQDRIEATVFGVGGPRVREADAAVGVRFISSDCSPEGKERIAEAVPGYYTMDLEAESYAGVPEAMCTTAYDLYLVAHQDTPDAVVKAVVEAVWENAEALSQLHPVLRSWTTEDAVPENPTIPFHSAAIEVYKEKGAWSPEMDAKQQEVLALTEQ